MEEKEMRRWLIKNYLYDLEIIDMCWLYDKLDLNDIKIQSFQEPRIHKYADYLLAKERFFDVKGTTSHRDNQLIFGNNSSYLLTDAPTMKEALDIFWQKHKEYCEQMKLKHETND